MDPHAADDDRGPMDEVVAGFSTKSDRIRALDRAGYSRSEIAKYLGIRYQHVWNVLAQPSAGKVPEPVTVKVGPGGRVVIPAAYRKAMGVKAEDEVVMRFDDGELRIVSREGAWRRAQERVAKYAKHGESWVDELIAERKREAEQENQGE